MVLLVELELRLINEKKAMLKTNRNGTRKGLRRESLRSSLDVWEAVWDETLIHDYFTIESQGGTHFFSNYY